MLCFVLARTTVVVLDKEKSVLYGSLLVGKCGEGERVGRWVGGCDAEVGQDGIQSFISPPGYYGVLRIYLYTHTHTHT